MTFEKTVTIMAEHGIHTRPAALLVKEAKQYDCDILVACQGKQASAKSLFKLQTLGLNKGATVTISANGEQAQEAVERVSELLITLS
ncbi:HPr family phosphocarrier protein [Shewanella sp. AS1]|uniref:HPr family phosphocarrier protein n=1 Tax=Shewanella sp. AS1 TaxID=2907626 RepID=UPI001F3670C3|nr:HPr family phosphocarrier protein [Shewanella sp. AS1]MCE9678765.1 HPr family phosphocarrier protein [Shewanella sp. AS1]